MLAQIGRFTGIGVAATLLHVATALFVQYQLDMSAQLSNLVGFCVAFSLSYMGHSHVTFQVKGNHATHFNRFLVVSLAGLVLSASVTQLVHGALGAPFAVAMIAVAFFVPVITFLISKYWAFASVGPRSSTDFPGVVAILGMGALCFAVMQNQLLNHDTAWYLVATRKWLAGMHLYTDVIEVNPPLNFYYTLPAIWIADATGLGDMRAQTLLTTGLMTLSLLWVWHILQSTDRLDIRMKAAVSAGAAFALFVPFLGDFAQREHTLVICLIPYLIGIAIGRPQEPSRLSELTRAGYAGLGLCLKPHFMLIPAFMTIALCVRDRSLRPVFSLSNWTIFVMGLGYIGLVKLLHPAYLDEIVPLALQVYGAYGFDATRVLTQANPGLLGLFVCVAFLILRSEAARQFTPVLAAIAGAIAVYAAQWTGYGYQAAPFVALISLTCIWVLADENAARSLRVFAAACLCIVAMDSLRAGPYRSPSTAALKPFVESAGPERRISVFSSSLWPGFPLVVASDAIWTSRYPALWPLPGALNHLQSEECRSALQNCADVQNILHHTRTNIVSDFINGQADLLIVDNRPYYVADPSFNYLDFLSGDERFEPHFSGYEPVGVVRNFSLFRKKAR